VIYRVRHVTRYDYQTPVDLGAHLAHLRPRPLPHQKVLKAGVHAAPAVSWRRDGQDHFGNEVTWLFLDVPHAAFQVIADATVDVAFPAPPPAAATLAWESVAELAWQAGPAAWQAAEFVFDSPHAPALEALLALNAAIKRDFTFRSGVTTTSTRIAEVLRRRQGVCQDFTHLMISALRSFGLPARYVSGYIRTRPTRARLGADQSHAWVGCWLGPEHGWVDVDPTNGIVVRDEHVVLGWGRDFADVTPLRGVILGGGGQVLTVEVVLEEATAPA
jgi:transglutaminase-like putative cysteine protease